MGREVERVSAGPPIGTDSPAEFGTWLRRQREVRGISVYFVAARTKLAPERIRAIEDDPAALGTDGHSRAIARSLARAIGADPDEATSLLRKPRGGGPDRPGRGWARFALRWGARATALVVVLGLLTALVLLGRLVLDGAEGDDARVVYRTDYLDRLLGGD